MQLQPVKYVPDDEIAELATQLIRRYERLRGRPIQLPVPVDLIIERVLQLRIVWAEIEEQPGEIILARIALDDAGQPTVQMNERRRSHFDEYFGTEPYSKAHEAGHWVLHYGGGSPGQLSLDFGAESGGAPLLCRKLGDKDQREYQAERFAAHLLLPEYLVREAVAGRDVLHWDSIRDFARTCGVSKNAMTKRLVDLHIITVGPNNQVWPAGTLLGVRRML